MNRKKAYADLLKRKEWHAFREKCLERAGYACSYCNKTQKEASLQVHHPEYANLLPWEYKIDSCIVLCATCHAEEHKILTRDGHRQNHP
jgi:5-methylcytosine-specific restriction endonuclease McrA